MTSLGEVYRVATNLHALHSINNLNRVNHRIAQSQLRLATGVRINRAEDDSAGFSIAAKLEARIRGQVQALTNVADAKSMLTVGEGALNSVMDVLMTIKEKSVQAASDTMGSNERSAIQNQINELMEEIRSVIGGATFNGVSLFNDDNPFQSGGWGWMDLPDPSSFDFQVGAAAGDAFRVELPPVSIEDLAAYEHVVEASGTAEWSGGAIGELQYKGMTDRHYRFRTRAHNQTATPDNLHNWNAGDIGSTSYSGTQNERFTLQLRHSTTETRVVDASGFAGYFPSNTPVYTGIENADYAFTVVQNLEEEFEIHFDNGSGHEGVAALEGPGAQDFIEGTETKEPLEIVFPDSDGHEVRLSLREGYEASDEDSFTTRLRSTFNLIIGSSVGTQTTFTNVEGRTTPFTYRGLAIQIDSIPLTRDNHMAQFNVEAEVDFTLDMSVDGGPYYPTGIVDLEADVAAGNDLEFDDDDLSVSIGAGALRHGDTFGVDAWLTHHFRVHTQAHATVAIETVDEAIGKVASMLASIGDSQKRLTYQESNLTTSKTNYQAAKNRIYDADFAKEQMELVKLQILQQSSLAALAQANTAPQSVLSLIGVG